MLESMRDRLYRLHLELPRNGLVAWTSGNISVRDPATGLVVIKPSGVRYEDLRPELMVIVDLEGHVRESDLQPSSDTAATCTSTGTARMSAESSTPTPPMQRRLPPITGRSRST